MRHYEVVVLVNADQHERGTAVAGRYKNMVTEEGGVIHRFEDWGSRRLAYPIDGRQRARYFLFNIECGIQTLGKLKDDFRYSESVIRSLVLSCAEAKVSDSPIMTEMKRSQEEEQESARADGDEAAGDGEQNDASPDESKSNGSDNEEKQ